MDAGSLSRWIDRRGGDVDELSRKTTLTRGWHDAGCGIPGRNTSFRAAFHRLSKKSVVKNGVTLIVFKIHRPFGENPQDGAYGAGKKSGKHAGNQAAPEEIPEKSR